MFLNIPFITTYDPPLPSIFNVIKKLYNLLFLSDRCRNALLHLPVVAFRLCPYFRDLLVTAKLSPNVTQSNFARPSGSFLCGKNCATCPYIFHGLTNYTFFSTGKTRSINSNITYETKDLIYRLYMMRCNRCNLQYIGGLFNRVFSLT